MPSTRARISMGQLMVLIAAFAFGLAISPTGAPYLGLLPPLALGLASFRLWTIAIPALVFLVLCAFWEVAAPAPVARWLIAPIAILISGPLWPKGPDRWRWLRLLALIAVNALISLDGSIYGSLWQPRLLALIAVNALILALFLVPWSTRKPFLRDLYSIKPGMTVDDVERIMAGYKERTDITLSNPAGEIVYTFRHSDNGWFNADLGEVTIRDGKVVDVKFLPD